MLSIHIYIHIYIHTYIYIYQEVLSIHSQQSVCGTECAGNRGPLFFSPRRAPQIVPQGTQFTCFTGIKVQILTQSLCLKDLLMNSTLFHLAVETDNEVYNHFFFIKKSFFFQERVIKQLVRQHTYADVC